MLSAVFFGGIFTLFRIAGLYAVFRANAVNCLA
jgi:hypothetical protein